MSAQQHATIVPREQLDFGLDGDIPKYWMDNDPFKTRFFDAMSTLFPQGEKFFITSVREYRDQITDPKLLQEVKDFTRQEAQHSLVHRHYNDRLKKQGIEIDAIEAELQQRFFVDAPKVTTARQRVGITAALEHLTAMMCTTFFERRELLDTSDPRVRAMYAWHAIEEVEHKAVAFDVLTKVAKAGYWSRVMPMITVTFGFPLTVAGIMNHMFKVDGFSLWERTKLWARGLWWFYKPGGLFIPTLGYYLAYYKPGFHPWKLQEMPSYGTWLETFQRTGDAIAAGNALHAAGQ
ncbi:metal-dependent hydrolase [Aquabacterium sp.]|uniref:metal-dependent hydrolase n=1 Tax=Aquabacterium sp. TaxID=1872578 RepID=UPI00248717F1|nr:metal-dependent hydrolase [Aquabacterium sp.]MDI1260986.1 metal-dependent hydrolase [Aquabacterium sp.]